MDFKEWTYNKGVKRVKKIKGFHQHAVIYIFVSIIMAIFSASTGMPFWIVLICMLGWGISIVMQAIDLYGIPGLPRGWEDQVIAEEMEKYERFLRRKNKTLPSPQKQNPTTQEEDDENEDFLDLDDFREVRKAWNESDFV